MAARSERARRLWARRGLAHRGALDRTTQAMLLRQLYLASFALEDFEQAYRVATQAAELDVLPDVMHQDAARAKQAVGELEAALGHLRLAARLGPASRRAFHYWTLGSLLFLAGRHEEAVAALGRAARWGTTDKALYEGHLALVKLALGRKVRNTDELILRLGRCPAGQGYGRFVLGQLAYHARRWDEARDHLRSFVRRTTRGRRALAIALEGELRLARHTLSELARASA
ncbi:MAG: tetratricopeptide repeat protein [Myxococcales bacterium]|nr:tetratricopeptide repeat protein [Myxococcales bacterium]